MSFSLKFLSNKQDDTNKTFGSFIGFDDEKKNLENKSRQKLKNKSLSLKILNKNTFPLLKVSDQLKICSLLTFLPLILLLLLVHLFHILLVPLLCSSLSPSSPSLPATISCPSPPSSVYTPFFFLLSPVPRLPSPPTLSLPAPLSPSLPSFSSPSPRALPPLLLLPFLLLCTPSPLPPAVRRRSVEQITSIEAEKRNKCVGQKRTSKH